VDYWATQSIAFTIPQPISANLSPPVTTTTTHDADKRVTVGFQPQPLTSLDSPLAKPCEAPRLHSGNLPALNATHLDVFRRHSKPVLSISGPRHGGTMFPTSQDPPASKSTRFYAFLTRCCLRLNPHTSQPRVRRVPRYSGSISSQIRLFRAQDPCLTNRMMDHHPPLL